MLKREKSVQSTLQMVSWILKSSVYLKTTTQGTIKVACFVYAVWKVCFNRAPRKVRFAKTLPQKIKYCNAEY